MVHVYEGLSLSDGIPFAFFVSNFPAARFPALKTILQKTLSVTQIFAAHGVTEYTRAQTEVTAKLALNTEDGLLELRAGDALLGTVNVNVDQTGRPIEFGRSWFAPDRVTLTLTLSDDDIFGTGG